MKQSPLARRVLRSQSDDRLVKLARQGRELAFAEIVRRYRPGLVAFAHAYAPGDRAEDVVQESLLSSWDALRDSKAEIRLKPWLYTIVRNRALNARRDAKVHQPLDETIDGVRQPSEIALANEELAEVVAAVRELPDAQRQALVQSALEGHTHEQIADAIGTSPGGVRQLVFRARSNLRAGLGAVVPLPLVAMIASGGAAGAVGGAAAGTAAAGAGGGSLATAGATVAAVAAIAVGGGVAIERSIGNEGDDRSDRTISQGPRDERSADGTRADPPAAEPSAPSASQRSSSDGRGGSSGGGDGRSGPAPAPAPTRDPEQQADQGDDARDAAEQATDDARDDERAAAEAAEEAAEEAEEAAEDARDAEEEAADDAADAAADAADEDSSGSGSSGSGSDGSGSDSDSSGSGSSGSGSDSDSSGSGSSGTPDPED